MVLSRAGLWSVQHPRFTGVWAVVDHVWTTAATSVGGASPGVQHGEHSPIAALGVSTWRDVRPSAPTHFSHHTRADRRPCANRWRRTAGASSSSRPGFIGFREEVNNPRTTDYLEAPPPDGRARQRRGSSDRFSAVGGWTARTRLDRAAQATAPCVLPDRAVEDSRRRRLVPRSRRPILPLSFRLGVTPNGRREAQPAQP